MPEHLWIWRAADSHASCILKIVAGSPAVGSIEAASMDTRIMVMGAGGMGSHAMGGGLGESLGMVINMACIADLAAMYNLFGHVPSLLRRKLAKIDAANADSDECMPPSQTPM
jgi:hypothetical protein